jgi:putative copper resistance protein D
MTTLLILARVFHFGSGLILAGVTAFRWLVLRPGLLEAGEWPVPFCRRLEFIFVGAAATLLLSGLGLFWVTAAGMSGGSLIDTLNSGVALTVLGQTKFGLVCLVRAGLILLLGLLMVPLSRSRWTASPRISLLEIACALLAVALLLSNAWTGHAAAASGPSLPWRIGFDALHLLAASVWPTGLLFFSLLLADAPGKTTKIVRRFSDVSLIAVAVLVLTGLANSWYLVGSFTALVTSSYGLLLCLKLSLLGCILVIAAWNRFRLLPSLFQGSEETPLLLRRLRGFVLAEFALAAAIVAVVAVLGITPPPH